MLPLDFDLQKKCSITKTVILDSIEAFVLDNGIFSVTVLPSQGGRIFSIFYRPFAKELLCISQHHNNSKIRGGIYSSFPVLVGDAEALCRAEWECEVIENTEDVVSLRLKAEVSELQYRSQGLLRNMQSHVTVKRNITLHAGEEKIRIEDVLENRNQWPVPVNWAGSISLQAANDDTLVYPIDTYLLVTGIDKFGSEITYSKVSSFPTQLLAENARNNSISFCPSDIPTDFIITFPREHAPIMGVNIENGSFLLQFLATNANIASDEPNGALVLPSRTPLHFSFTVSVKDSQQLISPNNTFSSERAVDIVKKAQKITIPAARIAVWRTGEEELVLKNSDEKLTLLMPSFLEDNALSFETLPLFENILMPTTLSEKLIEQIFVRTTGRVFGPAELRSRMIALGIDYSHNVALSPGTSYATHNALFTAAGANLSGLQGSEKIGYIMTVSGVRVYHAGITEFVGDFADVGELTPDIAFLPLSALTSVDAVQAVRLIKAKIVIPLGKCIDDELEFKARISQQLSGINVELIGRGTGVLCSPSGIREIL